MPTIPSTIQTTKTHDTTEMTFEFDSVFVKPHITFTKIIDKSLNSSRSNVAITTRHIINNTYMTSVVINRTEESFGEYIAVIHNNAGSANFKVYIDRPKGK